MPRELSVTGHNALPFMDALAPPLTTVRVEIVLPPSLMARGSTAPPGGR